MVYPPLTRDSDLDNFPGAPYPEAIVRSAEASIRKDAHWHIAPEYRETVTVECNDSLTLLLPSLRIVTLHTVTEDETSTAITGCRIRKGGIVLPPTTGDVQYFTPGYTYTLDITHGYASVDDLLPTVAARCQRSQVDAALTQRSETVGQRTSSESYNINRLEIEAAADVLGSYTIPPRFGA